MGRCPGSAADRAGSDRDRQGRGGGGLSPALAWRLCAAAGLAAFVVSLGFGRIPGLAACGPIGGAGAILAFELARGTADMLALFGSEPCTSRLIAAQRTGLWLDLLAFIPTYAAFLALGAWALKGNGRRLALAAVAAVLVAAVLDEVEGAVMFGLLDSFPGDSWLFGPLFWTVRPKFALLAVAEIAIALLLMRGNWLARIAAIPLAGGGAVALVLLFADPRAPLMMEGHRYAWIALLVVALAAAVRPALVAGRARE